MFGEIVIAVDYDIHNGKKCASVWVCVRCCEFDGLVEGETETHRWDGDGQMRQRR
jgi:hypothetical protein